MLYLVDNTDAGCRKLLSQMNRSQISFYLTGSRYFGGSRETSDYDFYTANSTETRVWLDEHDFRQLPFKYGKFDEFLCNNNKDFTFVYSDSNLAEVYRHPLGIDVQLQVNIEAKHKAQRIISAILPLLSFQYKEKKNMYIVWNAVYKGLKD